MKYQTKIQPNHINQFWSEPNVRKLLCNCRNFIQFARKHLDESDGLTIIKKEIAPIVIPIELESDITRLWTVTVHDLRMANET